jgi:hypothetical protein
MEPKTVGLVVAAGCARWMRMALNSDSIHCILDLKKCQWHEWKSGMCKGSVLHLKGCIPPVDISFFQSQPQLF